MEFQVERQAIEVEQLVGNSSAQVLVRAEALVPGAGRNAIEPLLADANLFIANSDLQDDRIVVEGSLNCQTVYRQGEESAVRALAAQTKLSHVIEIPGAREGMLSRLRAGVDHVDARYENGHIVFQAACTIQAWVMALSPAEVIHSISGEEGLQTSYAPVNSVKLAAESSETALLKDAVSLPAALEPRMSLMDWMTVEIDEVKPDLGGVRVKGAAMVETLLASGVTGRPAALVRYPLQIDQLVELPEWLTAQVFAEADVRSVQSRLQPAGDGEGDLSLECEAEVRIRVYACATDSAEALTDVFATRGEALETRMARLDLCSSAERFHTTETVRGTLFLSESAPGAGTVIAVRAHPTIGEWRNENGRCRVEGVLEAAVLYIPAGSDVPASAESELPFTLALPVALDKNAMIDLQVNNAEASALMSDRLEIKAQMNVSCETWRREQMEVVSEITPAGPLSRRPGIVICWPDAGETAWSMGKRYGVPAARVADIEKGGPVVLRI